MENENKIFSAGDPEYEAVKTTRIATPIRLREAAETVAKEMGLDIKVENNTEFVDMIDVVLETSSKIVEEFHNRLDAFHSKEK